MLTRGALDAMMKDHSAADTGSMQSEGPTHSCKQNQIQDDL